MSDGAPVARSALVTGGSGGIGSAIAELLCELGYCTTITGRRPERVQAAVERLSQVGPEVYGIPARMEDEEAMRDLVAAHRERFGRLDVLVNNAGIGIVGEPGAVETKHLDMQLSVNVRGLIVLTREALPMLRAAGAEHGKALIANVASLAGKEPEAKLAVYSATKAAVVSYSAATQKALEKDGVQVTALCPGFVDTEMAEFAHDRVDATAMLRPADLADAIRFLLSTSPVCRVPELTMTRPGELHGLGL
jgi:NAD(P)-dependent dehydrogenase (short-subunit alcohol dehydrogenase family)